MPGRVVDLSDPTSQIPDVIVVDTNLVIAQFLTAYHTPRPLDAARATQFFGLLLATNSVGLITSVSANEIFHFAIKAKYRTELPNHQAALIARYPNVRKHEWQHLYKVSPTILHHFATELDELRRSLLAAGLLFLQPSELSPIASGRSLDEELVSLIGRYGLDTSDTAILLEAQRARIMSIASLDLDLVRAQADFDIFTWR